MKRISVCMNFIIVIFIVLIISPTKSNHAQIFCDIEINTPRPVCSDVYFELSVFDDSNLTFEWQIYNGITYTKVGDESIFGISITDSTTFRIIVIDTILHDTCQSELFGVGIRPIFNIEFSQLQLTCENSGNDLGNTAKVKAIASGPFEPDEYHYFWDIPPFNISPSDSALAISLKAHQFYAITVKDDYGCAKTDEFWTEAYDNPSVEINADPNPVYIQNPYVSYSYVDLSIDTIPILNSFWWFSDTFPDPNYENISELLNPTYMYGAVGEYYTILSVYNQEGCDTSFTKFINVRDTNEFMDRKIKVYPNPAKDKLYIDLEHGTDSVEMIKLYNSTGSLLYNVDVTNTMASFFEIPINEYQTGMYNLHISTRKGILSRKVMIVR